MHTIKPYENASHNGAFQTVNALTQDKLIITEAPIDALTLAEEGFPAIALCGVALPDWIGRAAMFKTVWIATDSDDCGEVAAAAITRELAKYGVQARRLRPAAKDWNAQLMQEGHQALRAFLQQALTEA